jgi:hypothetical protein
MRYDRARQNLDRHLTTSPPPSWPPAPDPARVSRSPGPRETHCITE